MMPEEFKQIVKDRVRVFEDGGIRLLKKGKRGIIRAVFGRTGLVLALFFVQVLLLFSVFRWFTALVPHLLGGSIAFTAVMVIYLLNSDMDNSAKITWLVVIALVPVLGVVLFWWTKGEVGHRMLKRRLKQLEQDTREQLPQDAQTLERLKAQESGAASLACYLRGKGGGFPVYENTAVTYFPSGEAKFAELLCQLEKAKQYIFLEYFIIDEGLMWGRVLEVLARKAAEGVHVRVMYDGTCEFTTLPRDYPKRLERLGIACKVFSPLMPFVSTHYNYRDHRKVLVIDGKVGFTGGVNLADEYINHVEKFGRWKDAAVMLEGEAVRSLTASFFELWNVTTKEDEDFARYLNICHKVTSEGFVQPFNDNPLSEERTAENVYLNLIAQAEKTLYITTPYLIITDEMSRALRLAAKRGVDVRIITPGIPDKKVVFAITRSYYSGLARQGVRIFEYTPGFCHAKQCLCDGKIASIGSSNFDYRSLYHHFENDVLLYGCDAIGDMARDFDVLFSQCTEVTQRYSTGSGAILRIWQCILRLFAPLV